MKGWEFISFVPFLILVFCLAYQVSRFFPYQKQESLADNPIITSTGEVFTLPGGCNEPMAKEGQVLVWVDPTETTANRYFNLALDCIMLLDLELKIQDRRETWGVMADICRSRHNITKED